MPRTLSTPIGMIEASSFYDSCISNTPCSGVIGRKEDFTSIDKRTVHHYSSLAVDIAETVIRALARIVFIEDSMTSLKVMVLSLSL